MKILPSPRILEDDLGRNRPGLSKSYSVICWRWKEILLLLDIKSGFDETSWLMSPSGDMRFRLVVSRNCPGPDQLYSGDWKIEESDFGGQSHLRNP
jgi:hypothetical protein